MEDTLRRIVVGISGASGMPAAYEILEILHRQKDVETHLIITDSAKLTIETEMECSLEELERLADTVHDVHNMSAPVASGSFKTEGMIIVPCSMKTVAGIANGYSDNLLLRAADCMLKEKKKLILAVRECPLSQIHMNNMLTLLQCGASLYPLVMTFYNKPQSVEDMVSHIASKVLECFGIDTGKYRRWGA